MSDLLDVLFGPGEVDRAYLVYHPGTGALVPAHECVLVNKHELPADPAERSQMLAAIVAWKTKKKEK